MAHEKGGGPGTSVRGGVRSTLDAPWKNGSNMGSSGKMPGKFGEYGQGDSRLPTHVLDSTLAKPPVPGSPFQAPSSQGPNRPGTAQFKYGKG